MSTSGIVIKDIDRINADRKNIKENILENKTVEIQEDSPDSLKIYSVFLS